MGQIIVQVGGTNIEYQFLSVVWWFIISFSIFAAKLLQCYEVASADQYSYGKASGMYHSKLRYILKCFFRTLSEVFWSCHCSSTLIYFLISLLWFNFGLGWTRERRQKSSLSSLSCWIGIQYVLYLSLFFFSWTAVMWFKTWKVLQFCSVPYLTLPVDLI